MFQNFNPISTAKACFNENVKLFVNTNRQANPDNYNLYNGLSHLVAAVEGMQRAIEEIKALLASRT